MKNKIEELKKILNSELLDTLPFDISEQILDILYDDEDEEMGVDLDE